MTVKISWDAEAAVWVAINDELGLALESESYDTLLARVSDAASELIALNNLSVSVLTIETDARQMVCA